VSEYKKESGCDEEGEEKAEAREREKKRRKNFCQEGEKYSRRDSS
jgi:hypothetical protein